LQAGFVVKCPGGGFCCLSQVCSLVYRGFLINNLESGLSLKASWGVYHQFINRITNDSPLDGNRDYWLLADDKLPPARAIHTIGGIHYKTEQYLFSIEGFYKDLKDISEFTQVFRQSPDNKDFDLFLTGIGFSRGLEFLLQKQQGNFTGWLAYTMSQVEYTIPEVNRGRAFPADHDRPHELNLVGAYQWETGPFRRLLNWQAGHHTAQRLLYVSREKRIMKCAPAPETASVYPTIVGLTLPLPVKLTINNGNSVSVFRFLTCSTDKIFCNAGTV
jgi:hypothetical protein